MIGDIGVCPKCKGEFKIGRRCAHDRVDIPAATVGMVPFGEQVAVSDEEGFRRPEPVDRIGRSCPLHGWTGLSQADSGWYTAVKLLATFGGRGPYGKSRLMNKVTIMSFLKRLFGGRKTTESTRPNSSTVTV